MRHIVLVKLISAKFLHFSWHVFLREWDNDALAACLRPCDWLLKKRALELLNLVLSLFSLTLSSVILTDRCRCNCLLILRVILYEGYFFDLLACWVQQRVLGIVTILKLHQLFSAHVCQELLFHPKPVVLHDDLRAQMQRGLPILSSKVVLELIYVDFQQSCIFGANFHGIGWLDMVHRGNFSKCLTLVQSVQDKPLILSLDVLENLCHWLQSRWKQQAALALEDVVEVLICCTLPKHVVPSWILFFLKVNF